MRQDVAEAPSRQTDAGALVLVVGGGSPGYGAAIRP